MARNGIQVKFGMTKRTAEPVLYCGPRSVYSKLFSARCPHLGCRLEFNSKKKRFQCPCHGSIFSTQGRRLQGPAQKDMTDLDFRLDKKEGGYKVLLPFSWNRFNLNRNQTISKPKDSIGPLLNLHGGRFFLHWSPVSFFPLIIDHGEMFLQTSQRLPDKFHTVGLSENCITSVAKPFCCLLSGIHLNIFSDKPTSILNHWNGRNLFSCFF